MSMLVANSLAAGLLAVVVFAICRLCRPSPALAHLLWLLVLLKLACPPLVVWTLPIRAPAALPAGPAPATILPAGDPIERSDPLPAPVLEAASAAGNGWTLSRILGGTWVGISLLVLCGMVRRIVRVRQACQASEPAPAWLLAETRALAHLLGIRAPDVRVHRGIHSAFVWSGWRPRIEWPAVKLTPDRLDEVRSVLAHELAHIRRRDHQVAWFEVAATSVFWWHPVLWIARRRLRHEAEKRG